VATLENGRVQAGTAVETWRLLFAFFMTLEPYLDDIAGGFELSKSQGHVLFLLAPGRALPMNELAERLRCHASNVTAIVDALELRDLVERRADTRDRRVKMVAVTEVGAALRERMLERLWEPPPAIAALSEPDQRVLRDVMRRVLAA
jgi:DNA-binding MarR family transcriptional regulator